MFDELIYSYSRKQALADGVLVDVTESARDAGFRVPVACSEAVWKDCIAWTAGAGQSTKGRLWDVLWMARHAALRTDADRAVFELMRVRHGENEPTLVSLILHIGPGDDPMPVCTIMFPDDE